MAGELWPPLRASPSSVWGLLEDALMDAKKWVFAVLATVGMGLVRPYEAAADNVAPTSMCSAVVSRANLVRCALAASLTSRAERQVGEALEGRRVAASPLLPSNPVVAFSAGVRNVPGETATNWYATLSQEVEVAGQRSARLRIAEAEIAGQSELVTLADRDTAARAWRAYFEAVAARDELQMAERLEKAFGGAVAATRASAERGLAAGIEADITEALAVRLTQARLSAQRSHRTATSTISVLVGRVAGAQDLTVEGDLEPLGGVVPLAQELVRRSDDRPELRAARAQRKALEASADVFRRARIPNVTFSVFAQNDGFNERVFGLGLALPIPLPQPLGRTYAGEIAEVEALSRRASTVLERLRREIGLEVTTALHTYEAAKAERDLYTSERLSRAEQSLASIAREIGAGRLGVRDAIVSQQALMELLHAGLDARLALCLASVELARAAGVPLERGTP